MSLNQIGPFPLNDPIDLLNPLPVEQIGTVDVNIVGGGGSGGTSSNFGAAFPAAGTAAGAKDASGNMAGLELDASGNLLVNVAAGGGVITNFALETGGHLASLDTKLPAQGQALAAASVPVVLTAAQVLTLTPPAAIAGFALESGGHLASLDTKTPAQGQALAAASVPVVLTAAQVTTLTPPAAITGFALETGGNLASINTKLPAQGQALAAASVPVVLTAAQVTTLTPPTSVTAAPLAATSGGASPFSYLAAGAANQDSTVVKNGAGQVYAIAALSTIAALRFLKVYDKATGPTSGDTPVLRLPIPANASTGAGFVLPVSVGAVFANGISFRITTGIADADTGAATANDCAVNFLFK